MTTMTATTASEAFWASAADVTADVTTHPPVSYDRCVNWLLDLHQSTTDRQLRALIIDVLSDLGELGPVSSDRQLEDLILAALASVEGTPYLLNFWALWCEPCVAELPDLAAVAEEFSDRARVLTVSYDLMVPFESQEHEIGRVRDFGEENGYTWPVYLYDAIDYDAINEALDLPGQVPVTIAFNAAGERVAMHENQATRQEFRELMQKALE